MSAFFLTKNTEYVKTAQIIFDNRGIHSGRIFSTSAGILLIYPKQMISVENSILSNKGNIFCIGTLIYKGNSYSDSLRFLLEDLVNDCVSYEELLGEFIVLFDDGVNVSILGDQTGMYKLFTDLKGSFITSSFMAAAGCSGSSINTNAVVEQILMGFVASPDTLVNEILSFDINNGVDYINWVNWIVCKVAQSKRYLNRSDSILEQYKTIKRYMMATRKLVNQYGSESGASGGCDSRLIYVSVNECSYPLKSIHTHATSVIHEKEISVVRKLAGIYSTPLNIVPTSYILDLAPEEIDNILRENVMYFDARNTDNIGAFSKTHTRWYRKTTADGSGVTFSGIGGEIYRDFYYTKGITLSLNKWLEGKIFLPRTTEIFPKDELADTINTIKSKILKKIDKSNKFEFGKYYFDSYRIPQALSNVVNANNQMSFYLAPFTDKKLIFSARNCSKWQDHCGKYEGEIIAKFNIEASKMMTSKGYALSSIPKSTRIKWFLRGFYPAILWCMRNKHEKPDAKLSNALNKALHQTTYLSTAYKEFKLVFPEWNFSVFEECCIPLNNFVFTICALHETSLLIADGDRRKN